MFNHNTMTVSTFKPNDFNGTGLEDWIKDKTEDAGYWIAEKLGDGNGNYVWKGDNRSYVLLDCIWTHEHEEKQ